MTHSEALEITLASAGDVMTTTHSALAQLARTLAMQMDAAGSAPSTRLSAAYLSALKDVSRVVLVGSRSATSAKADTLNRLRGGRTLHVV